MQLSLRVLLFISSILVLSCAERPSLTGKDDPHLWLENIEGKKALEWVESQNKKTLGKLTRSQNFKKMEKQALDLLQAQDKIPHVVERGGYLYNFWQDEKHVRGLYRRTTLESFVSSKPKWESIFNLDQLATSEKENWVFKGVKCLAPEYQKCLISLSRGGKDAVEIREFDMKTKSFVKNGFRIPEAKSFVDWYDQDHLMVGTNFGENSLTDSGYPRQIRILKRGQDLTKAKEILSVKKEFMMAAPKRFVSEGAVTHLVLANDTIFTSHYYIYQKGELSKIPVPKESQLAGYIKGRAIFQLTSDWQLGNENYKADSVVAVKWPLEKGKTLSTRHVQKLYESGEKGALLGVETVKDKVLVNALNNVRGQIYAVDWKNGRFQKARRLNLGSERQHITLSSTSYDNNNFFYSISDFLSPEQLNYRDEAKQSSRQLKALKPRFDSQGMEVKQLWAKSQDGTQVPYFLVGKKEVIKAGKAPTLLYGYGGFQISVTPHYSGVNGRLWLERGGLYVIANIRGGGEFGASWHQAAMKTKRQRAFDDFIAVAEHLQTTGVTDRDHLAILGGSNGGLLVGAVMVQRPELFRSVVSKVPLLDIIRYSQLLAGASWMAEYGDPRESKYRDSLARISPYHNVSEEVTYPNLFVITSTKDDRVHPGHARKMVARMQKKGHKNTIYYENTDGGHAASANLKEYARMSALTFEFLHQTLFH